MNHLIILANDRLSNVGKCDSCKYFKAWTEYGEWHGDCGNGDVDKLPILDEDENEILWGDEQNCLLWEPYKYFKCEKHGFHLEYCDECEVEHIQKLDNENKYEF